jgi:ectoine hydroxylase
MYSMKNVILTPELLEEFESNGFVIISNFISEETIRSLKKSIDDLQGNKQFNNVGRWDLRNCLPSHPGFAELMTNKSLVTMITQILDCNIKLLGSHVVKMNKTKETNLPVTWHRDGGILSAELPDPLPPLFLKVSFCVSGSLDPESGELLVVPGSHRLIGEPSINSETNLPVGVTKILLNPGDMLIFDWRLWHAVNKNSSQIIRRTMYFTFGFRWLAPMDYQIMPNELLNISPMHRQLLGSSTELGNYLPSDSELPIKNLSKELLKTERRCNSYGL